MDAIKIHYETTHKILQYILQIWEKKMKNSIDNHNNLFYIWKKVRVDFFII